MVCTIARWVSPVVIPVEVLGEPAQHLQPLRLLGLLRLRHSRSLPKDRDRHLAKDLGVRAPLLLIEVLLLRELLPQ